MTETIVAADPIDRHVTEAYQAVERLHHAAGLAEAKGGPSGEIAKACADATAAVAHLAHVAARAAQAAGKRCTNCPRSSRVLTRRRQCWRDVAGWTGVLVALGFSAAGLVLRLLGY